MKSDKRRKQAQDRRKKKLERYKRSESEGASVTRYARKQRGELQPEVRVNPVCFACYMRHCVCGMYYRESWEREERRRNRRVENAKHDVYASNLPAHVHDDASVFVGYDPRELEMRVDGIVLA